MLFVFCTAASGFLTGFWKVLCSFLCVKILAAAAIASVSAASRS
jgi:hypothetical protein